MAEGEIAERRRRGGIADRRALSVAPVPGDEVGEQLESRAVALLGMELRREDISPCNRASKRRRIVGGAGRQLALLRHRMIAVREVEARAVGNAPPEGVGPGLT